MRDRIYCGNNSNVVKMGKNVTKFCAKEYKFIGLAPDRWGYGIQLFNVSIRGFYFMINFFRL